MRRRGAFFGGPYMKILVCGGAGYIGSNMTATLLREGHSPVVFDNLSKGHRAAVKDAPFVMGDFGDPDSILRTLREHRIEAVMHFAAFIEVGESVERPLRYYENNLSKTRTLLQAMENMSDNWLAGLHQATLEGALQEIMLLIEQARLQDATLADGLRQLADNFAHDDILLLIQQVQNRNTGYVHTE